MKNKLIAGLIAIAFFMLGAPGDSSAHGRGKHKYKRGYRAGYRDAMRQSHYRAPRYYAPRPVYRGHRYAHPPGRAFGYRHRVAAPPPVRVWVPAQRVRGQRGWYHRPGYYAWR